MYVPKEFSEHRIEVLHGAIREAGLATLVSSTGSGGFSITHLPLLLDPEPAPYGTLLGHVARANPHWREAIGPAVAIFLGPDAYITPNWYETKRTTGRVVPTWNYVAIHAHGTPTFFDDPDRLLTIVRRLTDKQEGGRAAPWSVHDAPSEFVQKQLSFIVGFAMPITALEGKYKMSQNRPAADREGVVQGLAAEGQPEIANLVADCNRK
jgi:transcriptional regulator